MSNIALWIFYENEILGTDEKFNIIIFNIDPCAFKLVWKKKYDKINALPSTYISISADSMIEYVFDIVCAVIVSGWWRRHYVTVFNIFRWFVFYTVIGHVWRSFSKRVQTLFK